MYPSLPKAIYCYNVLGVIIFGSVRFLSKKSNQTKFFLKKKRNRFKPTGFSSVWFFGQKPVQTGLAWFFPVWLCLGSVRFGFFGFRLIKPKPNQIGQFFQNFNRFFFTVRFFRLFCFPVFSVFGFFAHPYNVLVSFFFLCFDFIFSINFFYFLILYLFLY